MGIPRQGRPLSFDDDTPASDSGVARPLACPHLRIDFES